MSGIGHSSFHSCASETAHAGTFPVQRRHYFCTAISVFRSSVQDRSWDNERGLKRSP